MNFAIYWGWEILFMTEIVADITFEVVDGGLGVVGRISVHVVHDTSVLDSLGGWEMAH